MDAQQNRHIDHKERMKMLWRARFFLDKWRQFVLDHPHYSLHTHFISPQLYDILSIFIKAMQTLILMLAISALFQSCASFQDRNAGITGGRELMHNRPRS